MIVIVCRCHGAEYGSQVEREQLHQFCYCLLGCCVDRCVPEWYLALSENLHLTLIDFSVPDSTTSYRKVVGHLSILLGHCLREHCGSEKLPWSSSS